MIGGFKSHGGDIAKTELINEMMRSDCNVAPYPIPLHAQSSSIIPSGVVTCGGHSNGYLKTCKRLTKSGYWTNFPSMKSKRGYFDMKYMNGRLWAVGGLGGGKNTMESIEPNNENEWSIQSLPFNMTYHCMTALSDHQLLLTGGSESEHDDGRTGVSKLTTYTP